MFKDCLKRRFYHLEEFYPFGYRSSISKLPKILGNGFFISEIANVLTDESAEDEVSSKHWVYTSTNCRRIIPLRWVIRFRRVVRL